MGVPSFYSWLTRRYPMSKYPVSKVLLEHDNLGQWPQSGFPISRHESSDL